MYGSMSTSTDSRSERYLPRRKDNLFFSRCNGAEQALTTPTQNHFPAQIEHTRFAKVREQWRNVGEDLQNWKLEHKNAAFNCDNFATIGGWHRRFSAKYTTPRLPEACSPKCYYCGSDLFVGLPGLKRRGRNARKSWNARANDRWDRTNYWEQAFRFESHTLCP